jgi:hypothetical protein
MAEVADLPFPGLTHRVAEPGISGPPLSTGVVEARKKHPKLVASSNQLHEFSKSGEETLSPQSKRTFRVRATGCKHSSGGVYSHFPSPVIIADPNIALAPGTEILIELKCYSNPF